VFAACRPCFLNIEAKIKCCFPFCWTEKVRRRQENSEWGAVSVMARVGGVGWPSLRDYKLGGLFLWAYSLASELYCRCVASQTLSA
jgi:hypothetical protein